jgi:hypothetical protein
MRNENIQIVASDYYDDFQHPSSIFFIKIHFHYFNYYIYNDKTEPRVK